jgi:hypothetical protein
VLVKTKSVAVAITRPSNVCRASIERALAWC